MTEAEKILELVKRTTDDAKAIDSLVLNVSKFTSLTDHMVIVSGRSTRHVRSIADEVMKEAKLQNVTIIGYEGEQEGEWVLIDLAYVVVHVMLPRVRDFYKLEKLWSMDDDSEQVRTIT